MSVGKMVIVSGPSGAGKTTIVKQLIQNCSLPLQISISATTREPRPGEVDGVDYQFLADGEFRQLRSEGEFLECFEVFAERF